MSNAAPADELFTCWTCRALLTLEEKKVPYTKDYIDLKAKPEWCAHQVHACKYAVMCTSRLIIVSGLQSLACKTQK